MNIVIVLKEIVCTWPHFYEFDLIGERCEKNDDFQKEKQYIEGYTRFVMGAMFMKIIILKKRNSVCEVQNFLNGEIS